MSGDYRRDLARDRLLLPSSLTPTLAPPEKKMNHETYQDLVVAAIKVSPPVSIAAATIFGATLQDWVLAATLIYTVLQTALLIRKTWRDRKATKETDE